MKTKKKLKTIKVAERELEVPENFEDPGLPHRHIFSPSQFKTYLMCPRRYYFRYILGRKSPPGVALIQGVSIHKGVELTHQATIDTGTPATMAEGVASVADSFTTKAKEVEDWGDKKEGPLKDATIRHFEAYYRTAVPIIKPQEVEVSFAVRFGTVPVLGFIDLIDKVHLDGAEETTEIVSDLKFTGRQWPDQQIRFEPQMTFYAHARRNPHIRFDFLLDQKSGTRYVTKRSLRTPHDVKMLIEDLEEVVDIIKKGIFPRSLPTEWKCSQRWCGFYDECRGPK